jgi:hypothetical protein
MQACRKDTSNGAGRVERDRPGRRPVARDAAAVHGTGGPRLLVEGRALLEDGDMGAGVAFLGGDEAQPAVAVLGVVSAHQVQNPSPRFGQVVEAAQRVGGTVLQGAEQRLGVGVVVVQPRAASPCAGDRVTARALADAARPAWPGSTAPGPAPNRWPARRRCATPGSVPGTARACGSTRPVLGRVQRRGSLRSLEYLDMDRSSSPPVAVTVLKDGGDNSPDIGGAPRST